MLRTSVALLLLSAACSKAPDGQAPTSQKVQEPQEPAKRDLAELFPTAAPTLPPPYKGLAFGMTKAEADAVQSGVSKSQRVTSTDFDGRFSVYFDRKSQRLRRFSLLLEKDQLALLTKAWGPAKKGTDSIKRPQEYWFNPEAKVRAVLEEGYGESKHLSFVAYEPVAQFLGDGPGFAFEAPQALLGATLQQLRDPYGNWLVEKSQAQAQKDREQLEKFAGQKLGRLGKARPRAYLDYPPTEWGAYFTRVHPFFDKSGKVKRWSVSLSYAPHPAAKDTLFELFTAKWGQPKKAEKHGRPYYIFKANAPKITVEEDTITHAWRVVVE